jgi:arylsulfatase A-like enzyme
MTRMVCRLFGLHSKCFSCRWQDPEKVQEWTALYYAVIEEIDDELGVLMPTLGNEASNTLVIFTSDHGEMLGAHGKREKNDFYEGAVKIGAKLFHADILAMTSC